ncbi:MAG: response regulator [Bdellovibrionota bacterium]
MNILLCDDSNVMLSLFERRLVAAGYKVVGKARDGFECIELYKRMRPDLVLLDITMPNKDGRECLVELLTLDSAASVIMVSAVADGEVQTNCMNVGAKAFISKARLRSDEEFKTNVLDTLQSVFKTAA